MAFTSAACGVNRHSHFLTQSRFSRQSQTSGAVPDASQREPSLSGVHADKGGSLTRLQRTEIPGTHPHLIATR